MQPKVGFEYEVGGVKTQKNTGFLFNNWVSHDRGEVIKKRVGYDITADAGSTGSQIEFIIHPVDESSLAGRAAAVAAARGIEADLRDLAQRQRDDGWTRGDQTRMSTGRNHRFQAQAPFLNLAGQLQVTAGVDVGRLANVVSGQAASGSQHSGDGDFAYAMGKHGTGTAQSVWGAAQTAVRQWFAGWSQGDRDKMAGLLTLIAQLPLAMRGALPQDQAGFQAKTDFARIVLETSRRLTNPIRADLFVAAAVTTMNQSRNGGSRIRASQGVFPTGYQTNGVALGGVTIKAWLEALLPASGRPGRDLITPHNFPGTGAQKQELRAFGRFGDKTDPGGRPLIEWRSLQMNYPDQLPKLVGQLVDHVAELNPVPQPTTRSGSSWRNAALLGGLAIGYHLLHLYGGTGLE